MLLAHDMLPAMVEDPNIASRVSKTEAPPIESLRVEAQKLHLDNAIPGAQDVSALSPATVEGSEITAGIHEIEAPPPVRDPLEELRTPHLEDIPTTPRGHMVPAVLAQGKTLLLLFKVNCWLVFFSIWGTLARLGFVAFTDYTGAPVGGGSSTGSGVIWANFAGCVVMGFLIEDLRLFSLAKASKGRKQKQSNGRGMTRNDPEANGADSPPSAASEKPKVDKSTIPLYIGLTTGFCGSFTSFSSYILQSFLYLSNTHPAYTHLEKGYSVLSFLAYIILTLALSASGLQFGAHLAEFTQPYTPSIPSRVIRFFDKIVPLLAVGVWIGSIAMAVVIGKWRGKALFACVFSPLGALARFWVSRLLNPRVKRFPLGTFAVNIFGTAVLAGVVAGQYSHRWKGTAESVVGCQLLRGVGDGFCGCLTTVSTWVVEIRGLRSELPCIYTSL